METLFATTYAIAQYSASVEELDWGHKEQHTP